MSSTGTRFRDPEKGINIESKLKEENEVLINELGKSLTSIKAKSQLMKDKLILSNKTAEDIESTYDKALKIVANTMTKFKEILKSGSGLYCYLFIFILFIFFLLYWMT